MRSFRQHQQMSTRSRTKAIGKSGYSIEFISLVERGINAPSVDGCERIAKTLHISVKDLFDF